MGENFFNFDLENGIDFLSCDKEENREQKIKLGDNFLGKGIKHSEDSNGYEDCYGNRYNLKDNNDLYISSNIESDEKLHTLTIKKFEDGDYGIWLVKKAPYYYQDGMIVNYFTLEEAALEDINGIEENSYLQEENRLMDDFLWIYQGDDIIFPSMLEEDEAEQGQGDSEQQGSGQAASAAQGGDSADEGSDGAKESEADDEINEVGKGGKLFVCHGAILKCSKGTAPCVLNVPDKAQVYIKGKPIATIDDNKSSNIPTFATCKRRHSPPCKPKPTGKWKNGKKSVVIKGKTVLLKTSKVKCSYGGTIKIINPGHKLVKE